MNTNRQINISYLRTMLIAFFAFIIISAVVSMFIEEKSMEFTLMGLIFAFILQILFSVFLLSILLLKIRKIAEKPSLRTICLLFPLIVPLFVIYGVYEASLSREFSRLDIILYSISASSIIILFWNYIRMIKTFESKSGQKKSQPYEHK